MPIKQGLKTELNKIRETSVQDNTLYHKYVPEITDNTEIGTFAQPILDNPKVMNEFISVLVQRIVYTKVNTKLFRNPLRVLEGDNIPLGSIGQEIFINPAKGRQFNVDDFAGLLAKYEADVKVEYHKINSDLQYCVTVTRAKLKDAFVSWNTLEDFINGLVQSLYNGAYIDQYNLTKKMITDAYRVNNVQVEVIQNPNTESLAKQFITKARTLFLNMQTPSTKFNAWRKVGGYGRDIITWSDPRDIVFILRNDIGAFLDVNVLAQTFNIDKSILLGNIIYVNDFNEYDKDNNLVFDGSNIYGMIADKSWFKIKQQDEEMDEFYNANNRTWQYYLNIVRMYSYSLFSNAIVFASSEAQVSITGLDYNNTNEITVGVGDKEGLDITVTPFTATSPDIVYTSSDEEIFTVEADANNNRHCTITGVATGSAILTATAGNVKTSIIVTVE